MSPASAARVCCLDLDTFFVSVERLFDPSLHGRPVVVGAAPGHRGVVTACSYEVRAFGVHAGMSISEARRLAPDAVYLPIRHSAYCDYSRRVRRVVQDHCPAVQVASIDEFFLDYTGCERLFARPGDSSPDATICRSIESLRAAIFEETGLPASAGLGSTRAIAKMASGRAKPNGLVFVPVGGERAFVSPLPVRRFPGIGPVAEARLHAAGLLTLGQILETPLHHPCAGERARVEAGIDPARRSPLGADRPAFHEHDPEGGVDGSISNERTFHADLSDRTAVEDQVLALVERVAWRVRQRGALLGTLSVKVRYADFDTHTHARSVSPTADEALLRPLALSLLRALWTRRAAVRLVGVTASGLVLPGPQLPLPFARPREPIAQALDAVRARFGYDAVRLGQLSPPRRPQG